MSQNISQVKFKSDSKSFEIKISTFENAYSYPKAYFQDPRKIPINFPEELVKSDDGYLKAISHTMFEEIGELTTGSYTVERAKTVGFILLKRLKETVAEVWTSFGTQFAEAQKEVTPYDLIKAVAKGKIDANFVKNLESYKSKEELKDDELLLLGLIYFLPFRLSNAVGENRSLYFKSILTRVSEMINAIKTTVLPSDSDMKLHARSWIEDEDYVKIASILDMFLTKFPRSIYSKLKSATSIARFKDCTSLGELHFFSNMFKMELSSAVRVFHTKSLEKELRSIFEAGNEIEKIDSYTPYLSGLKLVTSSPYSTRVNPCIHHFVSLLGCCAGKERSYKAVCFDETYVLQIIEYCMFLADIFFGSAEIEYLMSDNDLKEYETVIKNHNEDPDFDEDERKEIDQLEVCLEDLKKNRTPAKVIAHFKTTFNQKCPTRISKVYYRMWADLDEDVRSGTMKEFLSKYSKSRI